AAGFNTDFAPVIDVNNNPGNPVIGTRSFSDDPKVVSALGNAYAKGLGKNGVIATFKHYPGHGDTVVDSHIGTPSVEKSYDELLATELVPFKSAIENGADMIMTAHITYPALDEEVTFGDGKTKGYYPATMSKKMIEDILRGDLGYKGVVVTDALEMDAIRTAGLVPGAEDSVEYSVNIAKEVINAGCDILLLPKDLTDADKADFYDGYIKGIEDKVKAGEISEKRIDESVKRILMLKAEYGIYDVSGGKDKAADTDIEEKVSGSVTTIGSAAHHETETGIAKEAITMLKNDDGLLPLSKSDARIFLLERSKEDAATSGHAIEELKKEGYIDAAAQITSDYYYDASSDDKLHYTDEMKDKIAEADTVIAFSYAAGSGVLDKENPQLIALQEALADTHKAGGSFVLISENLPYDAAIYKDADAVILGYMGAGLGMDPTEKTDSGSGMPARNANVNAAIRTVFGAEKPLGHLPVNIPVVEEQADGSLAYGSSYLYERGFGLTY
ncbi:MAG: glycoside hydrolase family 3 C-terminal domain-containing protein, partial [Lachnospiraceae bacterium]|nr:glycoside hydrolase family 3 C-terminal domain-containing protein [Lachnospiraceae bacterium]